MTYRELINEVLIRLREETISSDWSGAINDSTTVSDYHKVIGALVNDSKRSIESYHDWMTLRETADIATVVVSEAAKVRLGNNPINIGKILFIV